MSLNPRRHFAERLRRLEPDVAAAAMECESRGAERTQDFPRLDVPLWRRFEIQSHVSHRPVAVGANDSARHLAESLTSGEGRLIDDAPLPVFERLAALEAGEMVAV